MAEQSAGRVSLHPCFRQGLWTASLEITGEGGTPALFLPSVNQMEKVGNEKSAGMRSVFVALAYTGLVWK